MSKLKINLKMDIVAVAICPVVETLIGATRSLKATEPLDHFISIDMFNEMIELYNEKHKDDDKPKTSLKGSFGDALRNTIDVINK